MRKWLYWAIHITQIIIHTPMKNTVRLLTISSIVSLTSSLHAQVTRTWDNGDTGSVYWQDSSPNNWSGDTNPVSGFDSIIINDTAGDVFSRTAFTIGSGQSITSDDSTPGGTRPTLRLDNSGAALTVGNGGSLNFQTGIISNQKNGSIFTIEAGATAAQARNYFSENESTTKFVADSTGVTTFSVEFLGLLDGVNDKLVVDLTNYSPSGALELTLIDYGNNIGSSTFGQIDVTGIGGVEWEQNVDYTIDYGTPSGAIVLTIIPEPSSYTLLAGCLALGSVMIRRRK